jgi:hypothetical protein
VGRSQVSNGGCKQLAVLHHRGRKRVVDRDTEKWRRKKRQGEEATENSRNMD